MAGLISDLIATIKGQTILFKEVIALSADKKDFIIKNDIEGLRGIVAKENAIVPKALKGDKERERIMADIATVLNKKGDELTLTKLAELTKGQPENPEFVIAVDEFILALDEMKQVNDANKILIENALEFLEFNMNIVHSSLDAGPVGYGETLEDGHEPGSFLDTKS
ncbi:MAG: flagellar protein FlgN [Defluviitaleaceae bacterium]|nr:flagellar protein FlgN [Defluviitaleaceae bacterium]